MVRILKWIGIGVLSIFVLYLVRGLVTTFVAIYGMPDSSGDYLIVYSIVFGYLAGGFVTAALFLWKRRYALIGSDPLITILHAGAIVGYWPVVALIHGIRRGKLH